MTNNFKNNSSFRKGDLVTFGNGERGKLLFEVMAGVWRVETEGKDMTLDEKEMTKAAL